MWERVREIVRKEFRQVLREPRMRVVLVVPSWEDFVVLAIGEIRFYGASSIQVMRRLRALIKNVIEQVPHERRPALLGYLTRIDNGIARAFDDQGDRGDALSEDRQGLGLSRERRAG